MPIDLIELQPVFHQRGAQGSSGGGWQPQWQATRSTKCDYLLRRLRDLHIVPPPPAPDLPHWEEYTAVTAAAAGAAAPAAPGTDRVGVAGSHARGGPSGGDGQPQQLRDAERGGTLDPLPQDASATAGSPAASCCEDVRGAGPLAEAAAARGGGTRRLGGAEDEVREENPAAAGVGGAAAGVAVGVQVDAGAGGSAGGNAPEPGTRAGDDAMREPLPTGAEAVDLVASPRGKAPRGPGIRCGPAATDDLSTLPPRVGGVAGAEVECCHRRPNGAVGQLLGAAGRSPERGAARTVTFVVGDVSREYELPEPPGTNSDVEDGEARAPGGETVGVRADASRSASPSNGVTPPCMQCRTLAGKRGLRSILRKHSAFPRAGEFVPGPRDAFEPPPLSARPSRSRRRSRRALVDVEVATERRSGRPGAGGDGVPHGPTVLCSGGALSASAPGALQAEDSPEDRAIVYCAFWQHLRLVEKHLTDSNALFVVRPPTPLRPYACVRCTERAADAWNSHLRHKNVSPRFRMRYIHVCQHQHT